MNKPLLVGMNNPLSTRSGHELYPHPAGCTGHRLWQMLHSRTGALRHQYLETFERRNLVCGLEYDRATARNRAHDMVRELRGSGRTIVLLGNAVREAFHLTLRESPLFGEAGDERGIPPLLVHPQEIGGCVWRQIPHPSGRNLFYNDAKNREVVAMLLEELYLMYHGRDDDRGRSN